MANSHGSNQKRFGSRYFYQTGKKKSQNQKFFASPFFIFPVCFFLTLLLTLKVVPAIAQPPTPSRGHSRAPVGQIAQQPSDAAQLLQQGKQRYQAGQLSEATQLLQAAAQAYAAQGALAKPFARQSIAPQAQALNYLSLAHQGLGQWQQAQEAIETSINRLQQLKQLAPAEMALFGQALNIRGQFQFTRGETDTALETWKQAETTYTRAGDTTGKLGSQINQAQAMQSLGQYRGAKTLLERVNQQLQAQPDTLLKADGLRSLGVALQTIGDLLQAKAILEQSWAITQQLNSPGDTSATLFSIGNIARDLEQYNVAQAYYQEAAKLANNGLTQVQSWLNQLSLLVATNRQQEAQTLVPQIQSSLSNLPPSRPSVYARLNLAESLMKIAEGTRGRGHQGQNHPEIARLLATAVQQARELRDARAEAYSLAYLGKLYEQTGQQKEAESLTEQALQISQQIESDAITARAAGQLGRILKSEGKITQAIAAYQNAFTALQSLRSDLVSINPDIQFSFRESVEPIYRELVSLLLQPNASQADLKQARTVIEALQLAELDNFFRDACLKTRPTQIDAIDAKAAVIYPIVLSDRLEVILSLPNQPLRHYSTPLPSDQVEALLQQLYSSLYPGYDKNERLRLSQEIYNWLIQPAEADLARNSIATLVFIPDGFLRNLPMGVLYDGKQYLVEKYSLALSPGLQLFPEGLQRESLAVLAGGLTEARQGFSSLPGVEGEVKQIAAEVNSQVLLNQSFTRQAFQQAIDTKSFRVVHLATHGQFSSNPEETFLLTWDDRLSIKDFDLLFQKRKVGLLDPIELLVLSACQTAAGDKRATLGLAGFALRSGASSTLASLWSVSDESTANLMSEFYRQLTQRQRAMTKAEALRQAQLTLLNNPLYQHPYFWASFVLVGNWL